jgi:hypothetical protein
MEQVPSSDELSPFSLLLESSGGFLFGGMARQSGWPGRRKEKEVGE